jgi:hypothetical protein
MKNFIKQNLLQKISRFISSLRGDKGGLLLLLLALIFTACKKEKVNLITDPNADITPKFTDPKLRAYVMAEFDAKNGGDNDGKIQLKEVNTVPALYVYGQEIQNLAGIEYFTALTVLDCGDNQLTSLNLTHNTVLTKLNCGGNLLTSLNLSKNTALLTLYCPYNKLTALDLSKNGNLTSANCTQNSINPKVIYVWTEPTQGTDPDNDIPNVGIYRDSGVALKKK